MPTGLTWRPGAFRSAVLRGAAGLTLLGASLAGAPAAPAAPARPDAPAIVDPRLIAQVAKGPSLAIFNWDEDTTSRSEVAGFLSSKGTQAHLFDSLSVGYACAGGFGDLGILSSIPGGLSVVPDSPIQTATDESVKTAFNGNPAAIWSAPPAGLGVTGKGVAIGVVDTGVDATHPDLAMASAENPGGKTKFNVRVLVGHRDVVGPWIDPCVQDTYTDEPYPGLQIGSLEDTERLSGHGTHIAGVAAGSGTQDPRYKGMAPGADLIGVGAVDSVNLTAQVPSTDYRPSTLGVIAGLDFLSSRFASSYDRGVNLRVVLAGWVMEGPYNPTHPLVSSLENLYSSNITVVMPVGNRGPNASNCSAQSSCYFNPWAVWSEYDDYLGNHYFNTPVVAVAATPRTSRRTLAQNSSRGDPSSVTWQDPYGNYVRTVHYEPTIAAPGIGVKAARRLGTSSVVATDPMVAGYPEKKKKIGAAEGYQVLSGTSVAAAHVAGAIALMQEASVKAKGCYLTTDQVRAVLQQSATPMSGYGKHEVGAGMLDTTAAVLRARSIPAQFTPDPWLCPGRP